MSTECCFIKQEPGVASTADQDYPIGIAPEFVNIKEELEIGRIKIEPIDQYSSLSNDTAINLSKDPFMSANIPITHEEKSAGIIMKKEVLDSSENVHADTGYALGYEVECTLDKSDATSNSNDLSCQICGKVLSSKGNMLRHYLIHKRQIYHCDFCPKSFSEMKLLVLHKRIHMLKGFKCDECDKEFNSSSNLYKHKRTHLVVKPFTCDLCGKTFAIRERLLKHRGKKRCKIPVPLICTFCDKIFKYEYLLNSHLRKHNTDKPFTCDQCQMKFKHKSTIIRHIQLHRGIKPYTCKYCDKTFTHPGLMKPHLRVHSGEKPYQCPTCGKYFSHKKTMECHTQRHEKVKNLTCEVCNKSFPKESGLKYHMKVHVSEKYFSCFVCLKKFSHRRNILRHYKRKHPTETYEGKETEASVALKVWNEVVNEKTRKPDKFLKKIDSSNTNEKNGDDENESEYIVPDPVQTLKKSIFIKMEKDDTYDENKIDLISKEVE